MEKETQIDLEKLLNAIVVVSAKDGRRFRGKLTQYDAYMNLVLEEVEELSKDDTSKYKLILIKGGNVSSISV